jgi:hypothetical protein
MTQANSPGYPLPSGTLGDDDIVCQLVYLPDRDEYWRALYAALHYFTTWIAWERDTDKRGKDAASNWRAAFELTTECWRMACLEDLNANVAAILALLQSKKDCCDDNITYGPQTEITTDIEPDVGDPPDYYGETAVEDWEEWRSYACYNAGRYVDALKEQADQLETYADLGAWTIGLLGAALAILSFSGIGLPVALALTATVLGAVSLASSGFMNGASDDIEDARESIMCAIVTGGSLRNAVKDALGASSEEWTLFFSSVDYESAQAIMIEGGYGTDYLPAETSDDCEFCDYTLLSEDDYYIEWLYAASQQYHEDTDEWEVWAVAAFGCRRIDFAVWEDDTKTTRLDVRIKVTYIDASATCGGANNFIGIEEPGAVTQWQFNLPTLPTPDLDEINRLAVITNVGIEMWFKVYAV